MHNEQIKLRYVAKRRELAVGSTNIGTYLLEKLNVSLGGWGAPQTGIHQ